VSNLIHSTDRAEIWQGDCLDPDHVAAVMGGRKADLLFVDAPYSEKTHKGHAQGKLTEDRANGFGVAGDSAIHRYARQAAARADLEYAAWSPENVYDFCSRWLPLTIGWAVTVTDHVLSVAWTDAMETHGRYVFQPLPWVEIGSRVRLLGDGPSSWSCWVIVSRPKRAPFSKWGTLRGAYVGPGENKQNRPDRITGAKSYAMMRDLISDYSRPGDLVVDPCLGGGTTLVGALAEGRRCIGMEKDLGRATKCKELLMGSRGNEKQRGLF
jgi:hypothetical protein